jgi:membrane protease YdiL (CAAX protease family)
MGSAPDTAPPGWYPNLAGTHLRWWDGREWTDFEGSMPVDGIGIDSVPPSLPDLSADPVLAESTRSGLVWETRFVMLAFLLPAVMAAIVLLAQHVDGVGSITRFPVILRGNPVGNLVLGILDYLPVATTVPLALLLLTRTGQTPKTLGLGMVKLREDVVPAFGLIGASWGAELVLLIVLSPLLAHNARLVSSTPVGHVPAYYVIWGVVISATTAIAEEVLVNGYLLTRLGQLGWSPKKSLTLSLVLRTSYHIYYGLGFVLTIPFGYFVTRSFQKHRRLNRPIVAHFLFDGILLTIAILH